MASDGLCDGTERCLPFEEQDEVPQRPLKRRSRRSSTATRYGLHPTGIHVIDPASGLGFPLVAKIDSVQTRRQLLE